MRIKQILVPIDFSPDSLAALDFAAAFAKPFRARLTVVLAVEPFYYTDPDNGVLPSGELATALAAERQAAHTDLVALQQRYAKRGVALRTLLQTGKPDQVIAATAKREKADLIVIATRGRSGISQVLVGSVAERVVRTAPCPVLTLHASSGRAGRRKAGIGARGKR